jgi:hypothetical protein
MEMWNGRVGDMEQTVTGTVKGGPTTAPRLKMSFLFCILAIILMVISFFVTWYAWESESEDDDESRVFSRDWKLKAAHDSYEYRFEDEDGEEVHADTVVIDYDSEELSFRTGKLERENKFGTDYERTVKTFYLLFFLILVGTGLLLVFASGIGISFLKNVDRSNVIVIGGIALFFALLPALLMMFTIGPSVTEDNDSYELESRPRNDDYDDLYRYELEGSASETDMSGESGSANTTFENKDYSVKWSLGPGFYLSLASGILTTLSTLLVFLTNKDYFSHRQPYHPESIPAPVYAFFPRKLLIPLAIVLVVFFVVLFMLFSPLWSYEYELTITEIDGGEEYGFGSVEMNAGLERPSLESSFTNVMTNETNNDNPHVAYMDDDEDVMDMTLLFFFLGLGTIIFMIPVMLFMGVGKIDFRNGLPLLFIPAVFLLLTPLYFMSEFPGTLDDEFHGSEFEEFEDILGLEYDGSFTGSTSNNTTYEDILAIDSSFSWGPNTGWYVLMGAGILYLLVPISFIVWRKKFIAPRYIAVLGVGDPKRDGISPSSMTNGGMWPQGQPLQNSATQPFQIPQGQLNQWPGPQTQRDATAPVQQYSPAQSYPGKPSTPPQISGQQQTTVPPLQSGQPPLPIQSTVIITCISCNSQFQATQGTQASHCPFCNTSNQMPPQ